MRWLVVAIAVALLAPVSRTLAADVQWESAATGTTIEGEIRKPPATTDQKTTPTVIYLKNLSVPRIGQEADDAILADLTETGHLVLVLDYARHAKAISPDLNADVLKLRRDIADAKSKSLLTDHLVDVDRLFIVPEGFRLKRDLEFARDGERVLAMDVIYPSKPKQPVPALMEITCDNVNRMGAGSLLYCHDTLLEGGAVAGFAVAMIDHPVRPPYKGIDDPMPQLIHRLKAAVRTLRAGGNEFGMNGKIGVIGFSRGGPMAGFLAATGARKDLEGDGSPDDQSSGGSLEGSPRPHQGVSSAVQAAVVHGNRYDYLAIGPDDPMYTRFERAWGPRDENRERWATHGVVHYLTREAAPMFLNTSDTESPEFREGLATLASRLKALGVQHVHQVDRDGRGHQVSTDPATLRAVYAFLHAHLEPR